MNRQGVILAGGTASRLGPLTKVLNKHLLPVGDQPMILHGLDLMHNLGVKDVVIILGGNSVGDIVNLVRDGSEWDLNITYRYQQKPGGISQAIYLAKDILRPDKFLVLLGDNVFGTVPDIEDWWRRPEEALIVTTEVDNPEEYGQPIFDDFGDLIGFVEKIKQNHKWIVTGLYGLDYEVFSIIRRQSKSKRGEMEITDTLKEYLPWVAANHYCGYWADCGTHRGLLEANNYYLREEENESGQR